MRGEGKCKPLLSFHDGCQKIVPPFSFRRLFGSYNFHCEAHQKSGEHRLIPTGDLNDLALAYVGGDCLVHSMNSLYSLQPTLTERIAVFLNLLHGSNSSIVGVQPDERAMQYHSPIAKNTYLSIAATWDTCVLSRFCHDFSENPMNTYIDTLINQSLRLYLLHNPDLRLQGYRPPPGCDAARGLL